MVCGARTSSPPRSRTPASTSSLHAMCSSTSSTSIEPSRRWPGSLLIDGVFVWTVPQQQGLEVSRPRARRHIRVDRAPPAGGVSRRPGQRGWRPRDVRLGSRPRRTRGVRERHVDDGVRASSLARSAFSASSSRCSCPHLESTARCGAVPVRPERGPTNSRSGVASPTSSANSLRQIDVSPRRDKWRTPTATRLTPSANRRAGASQGRSDGRVDFSDCQVAVDVEKSRARTSRHRRSAAGSESIGSRPVAASKPIRR